MIKIKQIEMGLFGKKSDLEKLIADHKKLLKEAFNLSTKNRKASDLKYAEADLISKKIEELTNGKENS